MLGREKARILWDYLGRSPNPNLGRAEGVQEVLLEKVTAKLSLEE